MFHNFELILQKNHIMYKQLIISGAFVFSIGFSSCGSSNSSSEDKDDSIPEVKKEQVDSLLNNASNMINHANDSLQKDSAQKK